MTRRALGGPLPFDHYDARNHPTLAVEPGYELWSRTYGDLDDRFDVDLLERSRFLAPRVAGAAVVDLGCGTGRMGRWLRAAGAAAVTGVDRVPAMLDHARARGVYGDLVVADVAATGLPDGAFAGAVSSMVLCHVADLGAFFREARRVVRPGGWLAVVDFHPFFLMRGVPTHFPHPDTGAPVAIANVVHALRDFHRAATDAGLAVREFDERFVDDEWAAAAPSYGKHRGLPVTHLWVYER